MFRPFLDAAACRRLTALKCGQHRLQLTASPGSKVIVLPTELRPEDVPAFVELESGGPPPVACQVVGVGQLPNHPTKEGDRYEQHLSEGPPPSQPDGLPGQLAVPEQVIVSMAEIAESAKEGLLALAVGTGLQVMAAMFGEAAGRPIQDLGPRQILPAPRLQAGTRSPVLWPSGPVHAPFPAR
jgi:hypothetical protein